MMQDAYESREDLMITKLKKNILKTYYQWWHDRETNKNIRYRKADRGDDEYEYDHISDETRNIFIRSYSSKWDPTHQWSFLHVDLYTICSPSPQSLVSVGHLMICAVAKLCIATSCCCLCCAWLLLSSSSFPWAALSLRLLSLLLGHCSSYSSFSYPSMDASLVLALARALLSFRIFPSLSTLPDFMHCSRPGHIVNASAWLLLHPLQHGAYPYCTMFLCMAGSHHWCWSELKCVHWHVHFGFGCGPPLAFTFRRGSPCSSALISCLLAVFEMSTLPPYLLDCYGHVVQHPHAQRVRFVVLWVEICNLSSRHIQPIDGLLSFLALRPSASFRVHWESADGRGVVHHESHGWRVLAWWIAAWCCPPRRPSALHCVRPHVRWLLSLELFSSITCRADSSNCAVLSFRIWSLSFWAHTQKEPRTSWSQQIRSLLSLLQMKQ